MQRVFSTVIFRPQIGIYLNTCEGLRAVHFLAFNFPETLNKLFQPMVTNHCIRFGSVHDKRKIQAQVVFSHPCSNYDAIKSSRHMQKLLNKKGGKTTKKRWFEPHFMEPLEMKTPKVKKVPSPRHLARTRQVGHVLYDKIIQVINSGELCQDILEKQVNIVSIKVYPDMNGVNVFWEADRSDWEEIEQMLEAKRGKLRSLLTSFHTLGKIPPITFVKAKQFGNLSQLSHLLEQADYGPDYLPWQTHREKPELDEMSDNQLGSEGPAEIAPTTQNKIHARINDNAALEFPDEGNRGLQANLTDVSLSEEIHAVDPVFSLSTKGDRYWKGEKFKSVSGDLKDEVENRYFGSGSSTLSELNFRSDITGLKRDELMRKVMAKKSGLPVSEEQETPIPSFKLGSAFEKNMILNKRLVKQISKKEDRKMKAKLLERDASDFM